MKYIKMFNESINRSDIDAICKKYNIKNYTINNDGSIDVNGNVDLSGKNLNILPLNFRSINGFFDCSNNKLTSLEGSPENIDGFFNCNDNNLTSLKNSPKRINKDFWCGGNKIKNIDYFPKYYKNLCIDNNPIGKILELFIHFDILLDKLPTEDKELISEFIEREIIQQDILLINRLIEFLYDINKSYPKEYIYNLLKDDYTIR
ncbi:MAG: hypothetical protein M0R46_06555 [Candidatus Muirbacterium halophilum]|nr:hypothetical protein [Candidatus Muirbacterium halophilum]